MHHSIITYRGKCRRQVKDNKTKAWGEYSSIERQLYQNIMAPWEQLMSTINLQQTFKPRSKTLSWIPRIFSHFLNHATVNMYVIAKLIQSIPSQLQTESYRCSDKALYSPARLTRGTSCVAVKE